MASVNCLMGFVITEGKLTMKVKAIRNTTPANPMMYLSVLLAAASGVFAFGIDRFHIQRDNLLKVRPHRQQQCL